MVNITIKTGVDANEEQILEISNVIQYTHSRSDVLAKQGITKHSQNEVLVAYK